MLPNPLANFEAQQRLRANANLRTGAGLLALSLMLKPLAEWVKDKIYGPKQLQLHKETIHRETESSVFDEAPKFTKLSTGDYASYFASQKRRFPWKRKTWRRKAWKKPSFTKWKKYPKYRKYKKREKGKRENKFKRKRFFFVYKN